MKKGTMDRVTDSDKMMYGPRRLLAIGYAPEEQKALCGLLEREIQGGVPVVFCGRADLSVKNRELFACTERPAGECDEKLPRAVVMGGVTERELRRVMAAWKGLNLGGQLWAVLTPTSENWTLGQLLAELAREHMEMQKRQGRKP